MGHNNKFRTPNRTKGQKSYDQIFCLRNRYFCNYFYRVQEAYAHTNQKRGKYLDVAVEAATIIIYYDGPIRLAILYEFLVKGLSEPPDGILKTIYYQLDL